jgi:hypothetical protein
MFEWSIRNRQMLTSAPPDLDKKPNVEKHDHPNPNPNLWSSILKGSYGPCYDSLSHDLLPSFQS